MEPDIFEALGGFFRRRSADFDENMQRLREAFAVPDSPDFPGKGVLQDVGTGIDPTGGAIVPEREGASLPLMLAAGMIGPGLPADDARKVVSGLRRWVDEAMAVYNPRDLPQRLRDQWHKLRPAFSGAPTENLVALDRRIMNKMVHNPGPEHFDEEVSTAFNLLDRLTQTELSARALLDDPKARELFTETMSDDDFIQEFLDMGMAAPPQGLFEKPSMFDAQRVGEHLNEGMADIELFKFLLGIDP